MTRSRRRTRLLGSLTTATALVVVGAALPGTAAVPGGGPATTERSATTSDLPGLSLTLATGADRGIATFDSVPTADEVEALRGLGLAVRPMQELPLAVVTGKTATLRAAVDSGVADDVYPDERLDHLDTASSDETSSSRRVARRLRRRGLTGDGVTVGVVDSGCDGTHPDLADHITHNVTLVSGEYANQEPEESNTVAVPAENTDVGSGHGTHVAGIIAADGTSGRRHLGVAPDADLACFGIGAVITTTAVVTAYDYMMRQPDMLGIDVINNSWGNSFRQYDPADPVNVATRAVTRRGATVVFSAGNSGYESGEASVSPFNQAPWVISVAASDLDRVRGSFSSNGIRFDNMVAKPIGADGHTVSRGDRPGLTWPDLSAPGVDISSSCSSTGSVIGPCPDHGNAEASGTSMSGPHVAGAAAVLLDANGRLTPRQVRMALTATASRVGDGNGHRVPAWQVGHGHVNLDRAVRLVRGDGWRTDLRRAHRKSRRRLLREDRWLVRRTDTWQYDAPPVAVGGSDSATYRVRVRRGTDRLKLVLVHPTPGLAGNVASYTATVFHNGRQVATTHTSSGYALGLATLTVKDVRRGRYRVEVTGNYSVSDPDTVDSDSINGRVVFTQVAQLRRR